MFSIRKSAQNRPCCERSKYFGLVYLHEPYQKGTCDASWHAQICFGAAIEHSSSGSKIRKSVPAGNIVVSCFPPRPQPLELPGPQREHFVLCCLRPDDKLLLRLSITPPRLRLKYCYCLPSDADVSNESITQLGLLSLGT